MDQPALEERDVPLDEIRLDGGTQMRVAGISEEVARRYREHLDELPPSDVFDDGTYYWLADGFHRNLACQLDGRTSQRCRIHQGSQRDAVLFAAAANTGHGIQRSREDDDRAVGTLLRDPDWREWSDRHIASVCDVSPDKVARIRRELIATAAPGEPVPADQERKFQRSGKTHTMKPSRSRKKKAAATASEANGAPTSTQEMRDALGQVIPDNLRDVFASSWLQDNVRLLRQLEVQAKDMAGRWAKHLRLTDHEHHRGLLCALEDAAYALEDAIPFAVHTACGGQGCHGGQGCKGAGWVPYGVYEQMRTNGDWLPAQEE